MIEVVDQGCDIVALAAPGVRDLKPYVPGKPISELEREYGVSDIVKLASNENPLGPPPAARAALEAEWSDLARYPDGGGWALRDRLSRRHALAPERITLGNGSNDVLVLLAEAFLTPADEAVFSQYCFAVYPIATQACGATARIAPARPQDDPDHPLGHDLAAMAERVSGRTRLVFVANPNNPTGSWVGRAALRDFIAAMPEHVLVVVDEAYHEYTEGGPHDIPDASGWLDDFPNLVVTRTFSKAFGLAGLRVGYALSSPEVADLLNRVRQPFNVGSLGLAAATAALDDADFLRRSRAVNASGLRQLEAGLADLGITTVPSAGNFVLADFARPVAALNEALLRGGVIVRPVGNYGLPHHLRISVGTEAENARFLELAARILEA